MKHNWLLNRRARTGALLRVFFIGCVLFCIQYFSTPTYFQIERGFYYWESNATELSAQDKSLLRTFSVERLYVKLFEVSLNVNGEAVPNSKSGLEVSSSALQPNTKLIPTIYIENKVFKNTSGEKLTKLADNIIHLVDKRFKEQFKGFAAYDELQIDCDWTISTKDNYHSFLKILKSKLKVQLSATLRLYPYKFPDKMGVLPVDRAMLMCYNLISPLNTQHANSILEVSELEKYLVGAKRYPLPLDVALPTFNNIFVYKNTQFMGLTHLSNKEVQSFTNSKSKEWKLVVKDTMIDNVAYERGDMLKLEHVSDKNLKRAIKLINKYVELGPSPTVSFFQLNENQLNDYGIKEITTYYNLLSRN